MFADRSMKKYRRAFRYNGWNYRASKTAATASTAFSNGSGYTPSPTTAIAHTAIDTTACGVTETLISVAGG